MLNRNLTIPIPCPKCEQKIEETIARLETNPTLTCPACGVQFTIEAEKLRRGLQELEETLAKFKGKKTLNVNIKL